LLAERNSPAFPMYRVRECEDRHGAERDDEGRDPALGHQEAVGHTSREPEEDGYENARRDGDDHQGHPQGENLPVLLEFDLLQSLRKRGHISSSPL